ncbi:MFS transporter [Sphingomonas sp. PAMC 26621]|uniref:MFS transporter n=1 Tax=Sphingomonas sp. PAMC 26621 TaxID=1112213 RepID=UPI0002884A2E|nr:MFS transporter [Sphingomonas sp. PAMC 26621]
MSEILAPPTVRRQFVLAGVMAGSFMKAIEATIVAIAMPQNAGQLLDRRPESGHAPELNEWPSGEGTGLA